MPVLDGVAATRRITETLPGVKVVVLTMHDDPSRTQAAIDAGAVAYLSKGTSFAEVLQTLRDVHAGDEVLSPPIAASMLAVVAARRPAEDILSDRQVEILQMIADGNSTKQAARSLGITQKTVHNHLNATYRRLDTQSLTQAVLSAVRLGIIDLNREPADAAG